MLVLLPCCVQARLGETAEQLTARFGKPQMHYVEHVFAQGKMLDFCLVLEFRQDDWAITCNMVNGKCVKIQYSKKGDWTEEQIQTVLESNKQQDVWKEVSKPSLKKIKREWSRSDSATAVWSTSSITIVTPAYDLAKKQLQDKAKEQSKAMPKI